MPSYFVLLPGDWPGAATAYLCRPLIGPREGRSPLMPWLAVATGVEDGLYTLVAREGVNAADPAALRTHIEEARADLAGRAPGWDVAEKSGFLFKKPSLVRAIVPIQDRTIPTLDLMDDLSSELIVSDAAMAGAAAALDARELIAVVPKRGWLLVAPGRPGDLPQMRRMHEAADGIHGRAGEQAITPLSFFWRDGRLAGFNQMDASGGSLQLIAPDETSWLL